MTDKKSLYGTMCLQLEALTEGCRMPLSVFSNCAALMWQSMPDINWCGFYLLREDALYLGPFQGKPACTRIPMGKGVCGTAALELRTQLVPDVHQFPGHIACDGASNSEVVLPLLRDGRLVGVMDIDSPLLNRFDHEDAEGLERLCGVLIRCTDDVSPLL